MRAVALSPGGPAASLALHGVTIALSAFLLFLLQPLIARQILPWFGGGAGVWATCMAFFQVALVGGYLYSNLAVRKLSPRHQALVHSVLLAASLAALPVIPAGGLKPPDGSAPIARILLLLLRTVGLPYFMLATTGPLLQAWFIRLRPQGRVYRLYALSNAASLLALLGYPLAIEPALRVRVQAWGWSAGYALFALLAAAAAWSSARAKAEDPVAAASPSPSPRTSAAPRPAERLAWLLLTALGSILMVSVTSHLTMNVAAIPLLWVLPLAVYLLTFILCFEGRGWYRRRVIVPLGAVLVVAMLGSLDFSFTGRWTVAQGLLHLELAIPLHLTGLFVLCMFCHGELAARRPSPEHLTSFYLVVAAGGALGGALVGLAAPVLLRSFLELPLALACTAVLLWAAVPGKVRFVAFAALPVSAGLLVAHLRLSQVRTIERVRSFYGALAVKEYPLGQDGLKARGLWHGVILHGQQLQDPGLRREPTSYYGRASGIGLAIASVRPGPLGMGVIGAGAGTLAAYGQPGDAIRFYELNPQVVELARSRFTFQADSGAAVDTVVGDGRLSLEREPPQGYQILAVDAFSSDSIPVHLLTREAMALYARAIRPGGIVAFHVTNRYLDLPPVVARLAEEAGLESVLVEDRPEEGSGLSRSLWVLASADGTRLRAIAPGSSPPAARAGLRAWTDDYNNLIQALKLEDVGKK